MSIKPVRPQRAQGLVEFALLLPILVLFLMVIFDIGRATYYYSAVNNAAREGARYGAIHCPSTTCYSGIRDTVKRLTAGLNWDAMSVPAPTYTDIDPTVDSDHDGVTWNDDDVLHVTVTYTFEAATPFLARLRGSSDNSFILTSKATMRVEH